MAQDSEPYQSPDQEPLSLLEQANKRIAGKIESILKKFPPQEDGEAIYGTFERISNPNHRVSLAIAYTQDWLKYGDDFYVMAEDENPNGLQLPITLFSDYSLDVTTPVTTPYGQLNQKVIDPAGNLWSLENYYYFNQEGKSAKYERVLNHQQAEHVTEEDLKSFFGGQDPKKYQIDFVPNEKDSRETELTGEDGEKVSMILKQIEKGEFRESIS